MRRRVVETWGYSAAGLPIYSLIVDERPAFENFASAARNVGYDVYFVASLFCVAQLLNEPRHGLVRVSLVDVKEAKVN
jgi:hypothetical protein